MVLTVSQGPRSRGGLSQLGQLDRVCARCAGEGVLQVGVEGTVRPNESMNVLEIERNAAVALLRYTVHHAGVSNRTT